MEKSSSSSVVVPPPIPSDSPFAAAAKAAAPPASATPAADLQNFSFNFATQPPAAKSAATWDLAAPVIASAPTEAPTDGPSSTATRKIGRPRRKRGTGGAGVEEEGGWDEGYGEEEDEEGAGDVDAREAPRPAAASIIDASSFDLSSFSASLPPTLKP